MLTSSGAKGHGAQRTLSPARTIPVPRLASAISCKADSECERLAAYMLRAPRTLLFVIIPASLALAQNMTPDTRRMIDNVMARDSNSDGVLKPNELTQGFSTIDSNQDGLVNRAELQSFAERSYPKFRWVNPIPEGMQLPPGVLHRTFQSPSMKIPVGYMIYLPPDYESSGSKRYPVVYYLHGGRPGGETKSIRLTNFVHEAISAGKVPPAIYVYVNGGRVSHYNMPHMDSMGEDVFVKELIPHVDATYRTIAERRGRAIEGFSQGGRGTTRIMFQYPELFVSAAPGGPGYATEKMVSRNNGVEISGEGDKRVHLDFEPGADAFTRARKYAKNPNPPLNIMIWVGTKGFNYEATLEYLGFLSGLGIESERLIVPDVPHSAVQCYEKRGVELMRFHARNFASGR